MQPMKVERVSYPVFVDNRVPIGWGPEFLTNASEQKLQYVLAQVLIEKGYPMNFGRAVDIYGQRLVDYITISSGSRDTRRFYNQVSQSEEFRILVNVSTAFFSDELTKVDDVPNWDDTTKLRLKALFWDREASFWKGTTDKLSSFEQTQLKKAERLRDELLTSVDGEPLMLPSNEELTAMVDQLVDRHLQGKTLAGTTGQ